jgi:hypothetical protein
MYGQKMKIFSKGKVYPKFQKAFADPKINLKHQIKLYCEYEEYFSRS